MIIPQPPRDEWLKLRTGYVGGSEVAALFGAQPAYAHSLYNLHHVKAKRIPEKPFENDRMFWGKMNEHTIAFGAAITEGWIMEGLDRPLTIEDWEAGHRLPRGPFATDDTTPGLSATLDYVIVRHPMFASWPGPGALETKQTDWLTWKREWGERPLLSSELQLQDELCATGWEWGVIAVMIGGNDLKLFYRKARPRLQDAIRERVTQFWADVHAGRVPETDGSDSTAEALRALYAVPTEPETELPDELHPQIREACQQFLTEREQRLAAVTREQAVKNLILATIQDGKLMRVPPIEFGDPAYLVTRTKAGVLAVKECAA